MPYNAGGMREGELHTWGTSVRLAEDRVAAPASNPDGPFLQAVLLGHGTSQAWPGGLTPRLQPNSLGGVGQSLPHSHPNLVSPAPGHEDSGGREQTGTQEHTDGCGPRL